MKYTTDFFKKSVLNPRIDLQRSSDAARHRNLLHTFKQVRNKSRCLRPLQSAHCFFVKKSKRVIRVSARLQIETELLIVLAELLIMCSARWHRDQVGTFSH